jgi:hypothetical protein
MAIAKIESLLDKELTNVQTNGDVCSDISGVQKSKILEDRISSTGTIHKCWIKMPGYRDDWMRAFAPR